METDNPLISILMAVYEPRMDWLCEQLSSLDRQTYPNLRLYIRDDGSSTVSFEKIQACVQDCIHSFPYELRRNEKNLGSNKTFELLTQEAEGRYFAYCDQDDVWLPEKLAVLQEEIEKSDALLVCSDMFIINGEGKQVADSITKVRRHHRFFSGNELAPNLLISNFVTGCTLLIRTEVAKAAIPFCPYMVHDHYLALYSAEKGKIVSLPQKLIKYRIHSANQTLVMAGVQDKESYFKIRIETLIERLMWLKKMFCHNLILSAEIDDALLWANARKENFRGNCRAKWTVLKYRKYSPLTSVFEVLIAGAPESVFMRFIELKRGNII